MHVSYGNWLLLHLLFDFLKIIAPLHEIASNKSDLSSKIRAVFTYRYAENFNRYKFDVCRYIWLVAYILQKM